MDSGVPQAERSRYFHIIDPHFTLVFPVADVPAKDLCREVRVHAGDIGSIAFEIKVATINRDLTGSYYHEFLVPDAGYSALVKLHDRLYSGLLAPYLRLDVDFIPHIGIGNSEDPLVAKRNVDALNAGERLDPLVQRERVLPEQRNLGNLRRFHDPRDDVGRHGRAVDLDVLPRQERGAGGVWDARGARAPPPAVRLIQVQRLGPDRILEVEQVRRAAALHRRDDLVPVQRIAEQRAERAVEAAPRARRRDADRRGPDADEPELALVIARRVLDPLLGQPAARVGVARLVQPAPGTADLRGLFPPRPFGGTFGAEP